MSRSTLVTAMVATAAALAAAGCGGTDESTKTVTAETTPVLPGDPSAGKTVFLGVSGCGSCHALADAGSTGSVASDLDEKKPSEARVRMFVMNGKGSMPAYDGQLTEQEIADVAAYVTAVAGR